MRNLIIVTALAAVFSTPTAILAQYQGQGYGSSTPIAAGPHQLTDFEIYHQITGRTFHGKRPNGIQLAPQHFDGSRTTFNSVVGDYAISGGQVHVTWPDGTKMSWGIRVDGQGRFFSTPYGNELSFR